MKSSGTDRPRETWVLAPASPVIGSVIWAKSFPLFTDFSAIIRNDICTKPYSLQSHLHTRILI